MESFISSKLQNKGNLFLKTFNDEDGQEGLEFQAIGYIVKSHFQHQQQNEKTKKMKKKQKNNPK